MKNNNVAYLIGIISFFLFGSSFNMHEAPIPDETFISERKNIRAFAEFLGQFEETQLPYKMEVDDLKSFTDRQSFGVYTLMNQGSQLVKHLASFIPEVEHRTFTRLGSTQFIACNRFYLDKKTIAVVYKKVQPISSEHYYSYHLMFYDLKGNILSKGSVDSKSYSFALGGSTMTDVKSFTIQEGGRIEQQTYKKIWDKEVKDFGYHNNKVVEYQFENATKFQIETNGMINKVIEKIKNKESNMASNKNRC